MAQNNVSIARTPDGAFEYRNVLPLLAAQLVETVGDLLQVAG
jgi:hypothetical protein